MVKLDKLEGSEARKSLKLGDFGLAQLVSEPLYTVCGTPTYVAPEILAETGYGVKVNPLRKMSNRDASIALTLRSSGT